VSPLAYAFPGMQINARLSYMYHEWEKRYKKTAGKSGWIKSKFVCKFPQLERADYIIRVTFDTGFG